MVRVRLGGGVTAVSSGPSAVVGAASVVFAEAESSAEEGGTDGSDVTGVDTLDATESPKWKETIVP